LLVATSGLTAQATLTLRGELGDGKSTGCYYCPNVPFTIKFSETPVRSTVLDLNLYLDMELALTGTWNPTTNPPGLDVTAVQVVPQVLSVSGTGRIGDGLRYSIAGTPGGVALTCIAAGHGFIQLFDTTAMLLDPTSLVLLDASVLDNKGDFRFDVPIPNDPALIGLLVFSQSLIVPVSGPMYSSNPRRPTIR
jgi:hypothetical protein